jgi:hypothetical protein
LQASAKAYNGGTNLSEFGSVITSQRFSNQIQAKENPKIFQICTLTTTQNKFLSCSNQPQIKINSVRSMLFIHFSGFSLIRYTNPKGLDIKFYKIYAKKFIKWPKKNSMTSWRTFRTSKSPKIFPMRPKLRFMTC